MIENTKSCNRIINVQNDHYNGSASNTVRMTDKIYPENILFIIQQCLNYCLNVRKYFQVEMIVGLTKKKYNYNVR